VVVAPDDLLGSLLVIAKSLARSAEVDIHLRDGSCLHLEGEFLAHLRMGVETASVLINGVVPPTESAAEPPAPQAVSTGPPQGLRTLRETYGGDEHDE